MRVLIVKLSSFGDVVAALPAVGDLIAAHPGVEIDWAVEPGFANLVRLHPGVSQVIEVSLRAKEKKPWLWPAAIGELMALGKTLRGRRYDLVVDLQGLAKSAMVASLAGRQIDGFDAEGIREPLATLIYARRHLVSWDLHAVERNRRLMAAAAGYQAPVTPGRFGIKGRSEGLPGLPARYGLLLHAASWPSKLWPEARWRTLIERVTATGRNLVIPWGSAEEKARAERLAADLPAVHVLKDRLDGEDLATVIGRAQFAMGVDSGLTHLATALGVHGVWLYGPTDPRHNGPYGAGQNVLRSTHPSAPCRTHDCAHGPPGFNCMDAIDVERASAALAELLGLDFEEFAEGAGHH